MFELYRASFTIKHWRNKAFNDNTSHTDIFRHDVFIDILAYLRVENKNIMFLLP